MKKKRKNKFSINKFLKGFTLVELLAVIVILAIIMIIAIPAVLNTMETARRKTFMEFAQKVYLESQKKYIEDLTFNNLISTNYTHYVYSIRDDLNLTNVGDFWGMVQVTKNDKNELDFIILLVNKEFYLGKGNYDDTGIVESDIQPRSEIDNVVRGFGIDGYNKAEDLTKEMYVTYMISKQNCNTLDEDYVDAKTNTIIATNYSHLGNWNNGTCTK